MTQTGNAPPTDIGFIGLGAIGAPMAAALVRSGHVVLGHDVDAQAGLRWLYACGHGGRSSVCSSPRAAADGAEIVCLSLPKLAAIRQVVTGEDGLLGGRRLRIIIDLSTTGAAFAREMADAAASRGVQYLDCPVSGSVARARTAALTLMCAGPRASFDAVQPLLRAMGTHIFHLGEQVGLAQTMKLVNNALLAAAMTVTYEAMVFGVKAGLDAQQMIEVLNTGTGRNHATLHKVPEGILPRTFQSGGSTDLIAKDLRLYLDEAAALGAPMWATSGLLPFWTYAVGQGYGPRDNTAVIELLEQWAGVVVAATRAPAC